MESLKKRSAPSDDEVGGAEGSDRIRDRSYDVFLGKCDGRDAERHTVRRACASDALGQPRLERIYSRLEEFMLAQDSKSGLTARHGSRFCLRRHHHAIKQSAVPSHKQDAHSS